MTTGAVQIETFRKFGLAGRDFVIYGNNGEPRFEARQLDGSKTLIVGWTDNIPWTPHRLREVQRLAGGPGSIERIQGFASDHLEAGIRSGDITQVTIESRLERALGGIWGVRIEQPATGRVNIIADRAENEHAEQ